MKYMTHKKLTKLLSEGITQVTFTKSNGDERVIQATLDHSYLANAGFTSTTSNVKKEVNTEVVVCVDTEINEWRSFRVDSVTAVTSV